MTEAILEEPEFLKDLHRIREKMSSETKEQTFDELRSIRKKYGSKLLYVKENKVQSGRD